MKTIITHPNNVKFLREQLEGGSLFEGQPLFGIPIQTNPFIKETRLTGNYILPNGDVVEPFSEWKIETRFIDYGPEDLDYLLKAGIVKPERVREYYVADTNGFDLIRSPFMQLT